MLAKAGHKVSLKVFHSVADQQSAGRWEGHSVDCSEHLLVDVTAFLGVACWGCLLVGRWEFPSAAHSAVHLALLLEYNWAGKWAGTTATQEAVARDVPMDEH